MKIVELEAKIKEKLQNISEISEVFDFYKADFDSFPYAGFELIEAKWQKLDNCTNIRTFQFGILVFQEIEKAWRENAKNILYKIAEKIIFAFDSDETLDWIAISSEVINISINDWLDNNKWKGLYLAVTLNINTLLELCLVK